jgi:hypothetical protein
VFTARQELNYEIQCRLILLSYGRAIAQAICRRPLTADCRVRSQVVLFKVCGVQSGIETGISASNSIFPSQNLSTDAPDSLHLHVTLT